MNYIGSLGDGNNVMSMLKSLVTQIGNCIGLVSLFRSAYRRYYYDVQQFFIADNELTCEQLAEDSQQTPETCATAALADSFMVKEFASNKLQDFGIFLEILDKDSLESEACKHLRFFYIIIPALSITFVDAFIHTKNTLTNKNMNQVYFCDDGFPIGLAYLLKVFRQKENFEGLNWFDSVIEKYAKNQIFTTEQNVTIKNAEEYQKEFERTFYSFIAAQQLFKNQ